jgi:hypothetical protein
LVLLAYSVPSSGRSPPSGGSNIAGAPKAGEPLDTVEAHCSKGSTSGAVGGDGVPVSGATIAVGAAALEVVVGDGSPAPEVSPEGDTNVTTGATTVGDPIAKTGLVGACLPPPRWLMTMSPWRSLGASYDTPLGLLGMSPWMSPWVQPAGRLPRHRTCSTRGVEASTMSDGACCYGLPCSRSGQQQRRQGWRPGDSTLM